MIRKLWKKVRSSAAAAAAIHVYPRAAAAIGLKSHPFFFFKLRENDTGKTCNEVFQTLGLL